MTSEKESEPRLGRCARKRAFASAVGAGAVARLSVMMSRFFAVPLTLTILSQEKYGVWLMIMSFVGWLSFADLGIPSALQNRLIQALHSGNEELGRNLAAFSLRLLLAISIGSVFVGGLVATLLPWAKWFQVGEAGRIEIWLATIICVLSFAAGLPCRLGGVICTAHGRLSIPAWGQTVSQAVSFGCLCLVAWAKYSKLYLLAAASLVGLVFGPFAVTVWAMREYRYPLRRQGSLTSEDKKSLCGKGIFFLLAQIGGLLTLQSDAVLIGLILGANSVPLFVIPAALWMNFLLMQNMFLQPLWPLLSQSHAIADRKDFAMLVKRGALWSLLGALCFGTGLILCGNWFVRLWTHGVVSLSPTMALGFAGYVCCSAIDNLCGTVLDSAGWIEWRFCYVLGFGFTKVAVGYLTLRFMGIELLPASYALTMALCSTPFAVLGVLRCIKNIGARGDDAVALAIQAPAVH